MNQFIKLIFAILSLFSFCRGGAPPPSQVPGEGARPAAPPPELRLCPYPNKKTENINPIWFHLAANVIQIDSSYIPRLYV